MFAWVQPISCRSQTDSSRPRILYCGPCLNTGKLVDSMKVKKTNSLHKKNLTRCHDYPLRFLIFLLVGGSNPFEKYSSKWVHLPQVSGFSIKTSPPPSLTVGSPITHDVPFLGENYWKPKLPRDKSWPCNGFNFNPDSWNGPTTEPCAPQSDFCFVDVLVVFFCWWKPSNNFGEQLGAISEFVAWYHDWLVSG